MEKDYHELLKELRVLNEQYHMTIEGRKAINNQIREKINEIRGKADAEAAVAKLKEAGAVAELQKALTQFRK